MEKISLFRSSFLFLSAIELCQLYFLQHIMENETFLPVSVQTYSLFLPQQSLFCHVVCSDHLWRQVQKGSMMTPDNGSGCCHPSGKDLNKQLLYTLPGLFRQKTHYRYPLLWRARMGGERKNQDGTWDKFLTLHPFIWAFFLSEKSILRTFMIIQAMMNLHRQ